MIPSDAERAALLAEGREAFQRGVPMYNNPYYDDGTVRYSVWGRGWRGAQKEALIAPVSRFRIIRVRRHPVCDQSQSTT